MIVVFGAGALIGLTMSVWVGADPEDVVVPVAELFILLLFTLLLLFTAVGIADFVVTVLLAVTGTAEVPVVCGGSILGNFDWTFEGGRAGGCCGGGGGGWVGAGGCTYLPASALPDSSALLLACCGLVLLGVMALASKDA